MRIRPLSILVISFMAAPAAVLALPYSEFCEISSPTAIVIECTSTSSSEAHTRVDLPEAQAYETHVLGYWFTNDPAFASGFVYDQTFLLAPDDAAVSQALADASLALSQFLQPQLFSIGPPELIASNSLLGPSLFIGSQLTSTSVTPTLEEYFGPETFITGNRDTGGVAQEVLSNLVAENINSHTHRSFNDQYQATRTNYATYQITAEVRTVTSVPEPGTLALFALGLAGVGFARRKRAA